MTTDNTTNLNEVFALNYGRLLAWCRTQPLPRFSDPEDLVHVAYLRCRSTWRASRRSNYRQAAYIFRCLRWVVLDAIRAETRRRDREWEARRQHAADFPMASLRLLIAKEVLLGLTATQRDICTSLLRGESPDNIRRRRSLTVGAFAVHLSRARSRLLRSLVAGG